MRMYKMFIFPLQEKQTTERDFEVDNTSSRIPLPKRNRGHPLPT